MGKRFGAAPSTWAHWDLTLGLAADLLPVVCQPGLTISPSSNLTTYGKVPSRFDGQGRVVGFPKWTQHQTTESDLEQWSADDRLGICLQTRRVRAIDVDITDKGLSAAVLRTIDGLGYRMPIRTRRDSAKFLLLFEMDGEYAKQVLQTAGGAIEFLATGQQCVVSGTHPSGAAYEWEDGLPDSLPRLDDLDFSHLQHVLARDYGNGSTWTAGRLSKLRDRHADPTGAVARDEIIEYLLRAHPQGVIAVHPDRVDLTCPWAADHTTGSDPSSTSYFPAGTGGFETGHFRCLHAHCEGRSHGDFLDAIGWTLDGFVDERGVDDAPMEQVFGLPRATVEVEEDFIGVKPGDEGATHGSATTAKVTSSPIDGPRFDRDTKSGKIKPLIQNVVEALKFPDFSAIRLSYDTFTHQLLLTPRLDGTKEGLLRNFTDDDYTELSLRLVKRSFGPGAIPSQVLRDAVSYAAKQASFDSAIEWLKALPPWDGRERVPTFLSEYLGTEPSAYARAVSRYWWTAHVGRVLVPGIQADMCVVLISKQGTGKTSLLSSIVPTPDWYVELSLTDRDDDLSRLMQGKLIGELAELRGVSTREIEGVKAWISRRRDAWTPKYKEFAQVSARRLVLVGTSNQQEFLNDETGNRRWLPIEVGVEQDLDGLQLTRDDLWAEGLHLFNQHHNILWKDAEQLARVEHNKFQITDILEEHIVEWLGEGRYGVSPLAKGFITTQEVLSEVLHLDISKQSPRDQQRVGRALTGLGYSKHNSRYQGKQTKVWKAL